MKAISSLLLGIFFVIGQGFVQIGTGLEKLDGPAAATVDAVKLSVKAVKKAPVATVKAVKATAKAIH